MRVRPLTCLVLLASFCSFSTAHAALPTPTHRPQPGKRLAAHTAPRVLPGHVLALLDADSPLALTGGAAHGASRITGANAPLAAALARHGLVAHALTDVTRPGRVRALRLDSTEPGFDPRAVARELAVTGQFRAVSPDLVLDPFLVPDDTFESLQWGIDNAGGPDAKLLQAWDVWQGDPGTVIAVMDNGVDLSHPDLASQLWTNPGEIAGNHIDDDGDGWVDDVHGYDFGDGDGDPSAQPSFDSIGLDEGFHGTFVAGIADAATNNGDGIAGAAWKCRLMALKVADSTAGGITLEAVTQAFAFLDVHPAAVLNMSFGTPDTTARDFFQALVDDAESHGVLCVAAAGNDSTDAPNFPAACNHTLSVGAIDDTGARADFSQWGTWVSLSAPGASIFSSIAQNYPIDELSQLFYILLFGWDGQDPYMYGDGTSFASPLVAGIAGLVRSKYPALNPAQVRRRLIMTADSVAYDHPLGPRVNAYRALTDPLLAVAPETSPSRLAIVSAWPQPASAFVTLGFAMPAAGRVKLTLYDAGGRVVRVLADGAFTAGVHRLSWDGADTHGAPAPAGVYFARLVGDQGADTRKLVRVQ
jgi:subtilisin family serine protease